MDRSIAFYTDVLGCQLSRRRDDLGMVHLRAGTAMIDLVDILGPLGTKGGAAAGAQGRNVDHFCLRIEPFDEAILISYLHNAGLIVEKPEKRYGAEGEGPSIYCYDPDGNQVELKGPAEG
jgi:catechol 2,3-dioxygenase-like lactoylglutathione lyase family enzyme